MTAYLGLCYVSVVSEITKHTSKLLVSVARADSYMLSGTRSLPRRLLICLRL